jgi:O-antigen biosynthesis protein WbqP
VTRYERHCKRALDVAVALPVLFLVAPILVVIGVLILLDDGRPVIFKQSRVGSEGRAFTIYKFRSLDKVSPDLPSHASRELQPTAVGRWLRRTNVDELPQLLNVVRGDMSLVGPRPPLPAQTDVIEGRRACGALRLRPGLTGLAQVNAYDDMPTGEKTAFDCRYGRRLTVRQDFGIILRTFLYLLKPPPTY